MTKGENRLRKKIKILQRWNLYLPNYIYIYIYIVNLNKEVNRGKLELPEFYFIWE